MTATPQRLFAKRPIVDSEDSLLLRVLIQSMVSVGIFATDVAADTHMSLWAIPLSMAGAIWSWTRRKQSQVGIKFGLAAALLVALFYFIQNILGNLNDTRMVLAELLVQVQTVHTFDMPKRKDLGYSIVIGMILISVAATMSQTMAFAPLLLLFMALALPVLTLDYRSRLQLPALGLRRQNLPAQTATLPLKKLSKLLATALLLGLVVFALMPRLPSYQVQSMPMSSELPTNPNFEGKSIVNPGYKAGKNNQRGKAGNNQQNNTDNSQSFDDTNYYGFNQRINQNLRGTLKPQLVMRVRSQAPGFWRVLGFDRYTGQGWEMSQNDQAKNLQRSEWGQKFSLNLPTSIEPRKIVQSYTAVAELPNLLPALNTPSEVYFPSQNLAIDREGGLRAPASLPPNFTYTVISQVPVRDPELLVKTGNNYQSLQKDLTDYLQIPADLAAKLQPFTRKIVTDYPLTQVSQNATPLDNNYDTALYLAQYLKQNYSMPENPLDLPLVPAGQDLTDWFLFRCEGSKGNCNAGGYGDHFATVYTMMLRSIGIPARLAVGFEPGYFNPFTGMYEVKNTDAHALTEVYFPKYGWYTFDPIPNHPLFPPSVEDSQVFGMIKQLWNWVASWLPSPVSAWLSTIWGYVISLLAILWMFFSRSWFGAICGLGLLTATGFGLWVGFQNWRKWRYHRWLQRQPPMEQLYQQMQTVLQRKELPVRQPHETQLEHLNTINGLPGETVAPIIWAYIAWRYGGEPQNVSYLKSVLKLL
jgi:transglutaminase-like putative cysteine protease